MHRSITTYHIVTEEHETTHPDYLHVTASVGRKLCVQNTHVLAAEKTNTHATFYI